MEYSVRNVYKLLLQENNVVITNEAKLWLSDLPTKLKIRITKNYMPTFANLNYKRLMGIQECPRCVNGIETVEHVFRDCLKSKEICQQLGIRWPTMSSNMHIKDWVNQFFENNSKYLCEIFCCTLRAIWTGRNQLLHEGKHGTTFDAANFIRNYLVKQGVQAQLKAPKDQFVKINFDAAFCIGMFISSWDGAACGTYYGRDRRGCLIDDSEATNKGNLNRQVNGVAHLLVVEGLKRNAKSYLIGEVLLFAKEAVDEDYRQL
ncbi:hypothetical protein Goarm_011502, partial [Gossypium armourianum]|nr:hypothetical protein [Gossypium armourianum]